MTSGPLPKGTSICDLVDGPLDGGHFLVDDQVEVLFASHHFRGAMTYELWPAPGRYVYIRLEEKRDRFAYEGVFREVPFKQ